ncbi:MAG: FkbM family methyltransferase, partial [Oscillospiraceae bacterium]|nr:FkbM family methyltransferase [Oscillospiraceae bacterium]
IDFEGYVVDREYLPNKREYRGKPLFALDDYLKRGKCYVLSAAARLSDERIGQLNREDNINKVYLIDYESCFYIEEPLSEEQTKRLSWLCGEMSDETSRQHLEAFIHQIQTFEYGKPISVNSKHFDSDILRFSEDEIYVDCGAYTGDTVLGFIEALKHAGISSYKKIYAFECDTNSLPKLKANTAGLSNVEVIPKGLYTKTGTARFSNSGGELSIVGEGNVSIEITTLDEFIGDGECTFIKANFEGSSKSIMGAENVIKRCRPKLAIGCYVPAEHLITIPGFIKELIPDYKLYFRNYSPFGGGGVLYAI